MVFQFPNDFLWGSATAAHQVEGNNVYSDFWLLEHLPGTFFVEPSGDACDHYHRYPQDIKLLADLGLNAYRFSIEWARVQPEQDWFSGAIIEHYRRMLATCHENGLKPVVTFHHFTSPRWVAAAGGWENLATADHFARYCERLARDLGDLIAAGCTLNEPNLAALFNAEHLDFVNPANTSLWQAAAEKLGVKPQFFKPFLFASLESGFPVMVAAHRQAIQAMKGAGATFPMGWTLALQDIQPVDDSAQTAERVATLDNLINRMYLQAVREGAAIGLDDFVGVQSYSRQLVGAQGVVRPSEGAELTQMGYEFYPLALEHTIRMAWQDAQVPVMVTENGLATGDDTRRVAFIQQALEGVSRCLQDDIPLKGYFYWSMMDNFEWMLGYQKTFGIVGVDRATQQRLVKPSARFFGNIARQNSLE
ncbi:MAG TPA: family 1 glycosylhydrolase [Levilinea sp.]|nr:family 1 glycosylhydrolase [Levilinea sp.]